MNDNYRIYHADVSSYFFKRKKKMKEKEGIEKLKKYDEHMYIKILLF